jgi:AraC-like DNA-binding protein
VDRSYLRGHRINVTPIEDSDTMAKREILKEPKRKRGAPTHYDPKTYPQRAKQLAEGGATQDELGAHFGISSRQFKRWLGDLSRTTCCGERRQRRI